MWNELLQLVKEGNTKALARSISLIENEHPGYQQLLTALPGSEKINIIGITGPPGSGKSTLTDSLIKCITDKNEKVGVLCVDPSSPFNLGAVLGDRIRMSNWYNHPDVFIRSLATRGSMGGLHPAIMEIADLMKAFPFDHIIIETVGVGQSEIEIAGLADTTIVVLVPEAGDEIQSMKAGLMEIADIFVVNKADRPGADEFANNLRKMMSPAFNDHHKNIPVLKTIASQNTGVNELYAAIVQHVASPAINTRKYFLLAEKAWQLIQKKRMKDVSKSELIEKLEKEAGEAGFNIYRFIEQY